MTAQAVAVAFALALGVLPAGAPGAAAEQAKKDTTVDKATVVTPSVRAHRVIAYYFHTTQRCASCRAIEAYSREAIESAFSEQIRDGRLVWKAVNTDTKGNQHYVEDYKLYTKSLILVNEVRGRKPQWKNLEKVWQLLQDKEKFLRYVQEETRNYLAAR